MTRHLIILNDPPYGTERSYNGLRLANSLAKGEGVGVSVFLMGHAASCALAGQATPPGYYNIERMLKIFASKGGEIGVCGSCMDARGIKPESLVVGAHRSSMEELTAWTQEAGRVLVF
ncbi:MAG: DsrE family protein [Acidobacteriota bacterium]